MNDNFKFVELDKSRFTEELQMNKWITEDWEFTISVKSGKAEHCRLGFETGDIFRC